MLIFILALDPTQENPVAGSDKIRHATAGTRWGNDLSYVKNLGPFVRFGDAAGQGDAQTQTKP
jgi:hypothetical protein